MAPRDHNPGILDPVSQLLIAPMETIPRRSAKSLCVQPFSRRHLRSASPAGCLDLLRMSSRLTRSRTFGNRYFGLDVLREVEHTPPMRTTTAARSNCHALADRDTYRVAPVQNNRTRGVTVGIDSSGQAVSDGHVIIVTRRTLWRHSAPPALLP